MQYILSLPEGEEGARDTREGEGVCLHAPHPDHLPAGEREFRLICAVDMIWMVFVRLSLALYLYR